MTKRPELKEWISLSRSISVETEEAFAAAVEEMLNECSLAGYEPMFVTAAGTHGHIPIVSGRRRGALR